MRLVEAFFDRYPFAASLTMTATCAEKEGAYVSKQLEAKFFRKLYDAFPELIDVLCCDLEEQQYCLATGLRPHASSIRPQV